jgi:FG-GAP repeat
MVGGTSDTTSNDPIPSWNDTPSKRAITAFKPWTWGLQGGDDGTVDTVVGSREAGDSFGSAIAAYGPVIAVGAPGASGGRGAVHLFDRRGRLRRTIVSDDPNAGCFGNAVAVRRDAVLVGAPCTSLADGEEGAAYLYSTRTGALIGSYPGRDEGGRLGLNVALLRTAVALAGRGPDTADNGVVRLVPR